MPGIRGVGVKTAAKLIEKYGTAEAVIAHADEQTPKLRENLLAGADGLALTRRLVTLKRDVELEFDLEACATPNVTKADVRDLFEVLGFRGLLDTIPDDPEASEPERPTAPAATSYRHVATEADLAELVAALKGVATLAIDTETTGLSVVDDDLVGYALSWEAGTGWYVPVRSHAGPTLDPELVREALRPVLEDEDVRKVGHHLKFDLSVLEREGITLGGPIFDTLIAAALLNPERRGNSMDDLARDLLGHATIPITDLIGKGKNQTSMLDVPLDVLATYAAEDADVTWRLFEVLEPQLAATDADLVRLFDDVELPLVRVLAAMERAGVTIDVARLAEYRTELAGRIEALRGRVLEAAGSDFNVDSPKQLAEVLFGELGFRVVKKTKTGASTDAEVLDTLAAETQHPLPELVLEYRELTKLLGTYVDPLPSYVSPTTGRLHASFHQTGAATGRLSSSDPNIQNIPIRSDAGREIRRAFVARDDDHLLLAADYSQVELRVLAHFSEDPALLEAFRARPRHPRLRGVADLRRAHRGRHVRAARGRQDGQLRDRLRPDRLRSGAHARASTRRRAGLHRRLQGDATPASTRFLQRCVDEAREHGYVETILGRRRPIPQVTLAQLRRARARRTPRHQHGDPGLGRRPDQAGDGATRTRAWRARATGARMLIQVHDELVLETPKAHADAAVRATVEEMQGAIELRVPLKVDASLGPNWLEGKG